jgi:hypothetical protein
MRHPPCWSTVYRMINALAGTFSGVRGEGDAVIRCWNVPAIPDEPFPIDYLGDAAGCGDHGSRGVLFGT